MSYRLRIATEGFRGETANRRISIATRGYRPFYILGDFWKSIVSFSMYVRKRFDIGLG